MLRLRKRLNAVVVVAAVVAAAVTAAAAGMVRSSSSTSGEKYEEKGIHVFDYVTLFIYVQTVSLTICVKKLFYLNYIEKSHKMRVS
jgi:hypothetical protein